MGASAVLQIVKSGGQPNQASNEIAAAEGSRERADPRKGRAVGLATVRPSSA